MIFEYYQNGSIWKKLRMHDAPLEIGCVHVSTGKADKAGAY